MRLHESKLTIADNVDGTLLRRDQFIQPELLDHLREQRDASVTTPAGDYMHVCAVPTQIVDVWMSQGFNIYQQPAKAILARLRAEGLDAFIATNKAL